MRILLVDDEHLARQRLARMVEQMPDYEVVGEAANGMEAVQLVNDTQPDLVLLDIRMPGMDGLETARHFIDFEQPPAVIFCTAYEEHAIEAFNLQAVGYLLKPVRKDDLAQALGKSQRVNKAQLAALRDTDERRRSHISARTRRGVELIPVDQVAFFQADQKYVTVRYGDSEVIIDDTLRELEEEFSDLFLRIHRNALVASAHIEALEKTSDGHFQIRMRGVDQLLDVSRRHVASVRRFLKQL